MRLLKLFCTLAVCALALPAQTVALMPNAAQQFFDINGKPLAGGTIYTYAAGTSTPLSTYTDATGTVQQTNPIQLDSSGSPQRGGIWLTAASYKIVVKNLAGVTIRTVDNVRDLSLASSSGYSVMSYGAKGNGVTDDSAAIAATCTAANGGQVIFPPATYRIVAGNITTCKAGTTLVGNSSTLDLTGMSTLTAAFTINIGGSYNEQTPPTVIQGFNVVGSQTTFGVSFVRVDQTPNVTIRDISAYAVGVAFLGGKDTNAVLDHISVTNPTGNSIYFSPSTYGVSPTGTVSNLYCANAQTAGVACVRADGGTVQILNPFIDAVPVGIYAGGPAAINLSGGTITLEGTQAATGFYIASGSGANNATISGTTFTFSDAASHADIAIDNEQVNTTLNLHASFVNQAQSGSSVTVLKTSDVITLDMTGCSFLSWPFAITPVIFDLTSFNAQINGTITGNQFSVSSLSGQTINLVSTGAAGGFVDALISGNTFTNVQNMLNIGFSGGLTYVTGNYMLTHGSVPAPNVTFASGNGVVLTNNFFTVGPSVGAVKAAACSGNTNYACN